MPTPRLSVLIAELFERSQQQNADEKLELLVAGVVAVARDDGRLTISLDSGPTVTADPTTDEPFIQGQKVWVSKTEDGTFIVHGGIK